mmetsp:Transcript_5402/g.13099  ORF Transcript_5402/g.13099 Transcript_5402/m.13099 type:complete len:94 (-) Transcript_5402:197-478(-)
MKSAHESMDEVFRSHFASLHVRVTNKAAIHLYKNILEYDVHDVEDKYYADGENAYDMRKYFERGKAKQRTKTDRGDRSGDAAKGGGGGKPPDA